VAGLAEEVLNFKLKSTKKVANASSAVPAKPTPEAAQPPWAGLQKKQGQAKGAKIAPSVGDQGNRNQGVPAPQTKAGAVRQTEQSQRLYRGGAGGGFFGGNATNSFNAQKDASSSTKQPGLTESETLNPQVQQTQAPIKDITAESLMLITPLLRRPEFERVVIEGDHEDWMTGSPAKKGAVHASPEATPMVSNMRDQQGKKDDLAESAVQSSDTEQRVLNL